ncbi:cobalamin B12-binding domain-containing protein [Methylobacterium marchantiae]
MGRLQRIMHDLTARFRSEPAPDPHGRSIFLMSCPGETHSFGLSLVERFFRDAGWDVTSAAHEPHSDVIRTASTGWFDVIGVSLGCETLLPALTRTVTELRRASRNPSVRVMVGGPIFLENPDHSALVGADATASDARLALTIAESLLDPRARPC